MILDDSKHPLFGKETTCHQCHGPAVWVFNGNNVGNYHYCRKCKIETGPFAKGVKTEKAAEAKDETYFWSSGLTSYLVAPRPSSTPKFQSGDIVEATASSLCGGIFAGLFYTVASPEIGGLVSIRVDSNGIRNAMWLASFFKLNSRPPIQSLHATNIQINPSGLITPRPGSTAITAAMETQERWFQYSEKLNTDYNYPNDKPDEKNWD